MPKPADLSAFPSEKQFASWLGLVPTNEQSGLARKLACLFYRLIKHGQPCVDKGTRYYEAMYREQQIRSLTKRAQKLGLELVIPKTA